MLLERAKPAFERSPARRAVKTEIPGGDRRRNSGFASAGTDIWSRACH